MDPFILCLLSLGISFPKLRLPLSCVAQIDSLSTSEFWGIDDATNLDELQETADVTLESGYVSEHNFAPGKLEARTSGERDKVALRR